jgi:hypothetical protein
MTSSQHVYEVRPRKERRGVDPISDLPPFGRLWYGAPNAILRSTLQFRIRRRNLREILRRFA